MLNKIFIFIKKYLKNQLKELSFKFYIISFIQLTICEKDWDELKMVFTQHFINNLTKLYDFYLFLKSFYVILFIHFSSF